VISDHDVSGIGGRFVNVWGSSTGTRIENNVATGCGHGAAVSGAQNYAIKNNDFSNSSGVAIYVGADADYAVIENNVGSGSQTGLEIYRADHVTVDNNDFSNCTQYGLYVSDGYYTDYTEIKNSNFSSAGTYGMYFYQGKAYHWTVDNNLISGDTAGMRFRWEYFWYGTISNNYISGGSYGIAAGAADQWLYFRYNLIENNHIYGTQNGIYFYRECDTNTVRNNWIYNNTDGIRIVQTNCTGSCFYRNRFENNTGYDAYDPSTNDWDNSELQQGNWWDDWQPPDHPDDNGDGVVDEPRPISGGSRYDHYPLVIYLPPGEPQLYLPADGEKTNDNTPTFEWTLGSDTATQRLVIDDDPNFSDGDNLYDNGNLVTENSCTIENELDDGVYYWKVIATNDEGSTESQTRSFLVDTVGPPAPTLSSPSDGAILDSTTVTFEWQTVTDSTAKSSDVSGIACYEIWVDDDQSFSSPTIENTPDNTSSSRTIYNLTGRNYWRVRAWDQAGNPGGFSSTRDFNVAGFSLSASSSSITILKGNTGSVGLTIGLLYGDPETVTLDYSWDEEPQGATVSISPDTGSPPFTSNLSIQTTTDASTGTYTLTITASVGDTQLTRDITVGITGMSFIIISSPSSLSMLRSDSSTSTVSVKFMMGAKENVTLAGSWHGTAPTGVSASLSPSTGTPSYDATLSFTTSSSASSGTYTYRVTGSGGGLEQWIDVKVSISTSLSITLSTDKTSYEKGQTINISGTVLDPNGDSVGDGTATITLSTGTWSDNVQTSISNGVYSASYYITYDKPEGTWTVSVTAVDNRGHETPSPENTSITVSVPESHKHYTVSISSPSAGEVFKRGDTVTFTVDLTENGRKVRGATVRIRKPSGDDIFLSEESPGLYSGSYQLGWDDDLGQWSVYVEGMTDEDGVLKAGFDYTSIKVEPTNLSINLIEPSSTRFEVGETVKVKLEVSYPDGTPVDEGVITALGPNGENLVFVREERGVYTATYVVDSTGEWGLQVSVADAYGNSGSTTETTVQFVSPATTSYLIRYWWAVLAIASALGGAATIVARSRLRVRQLRNIRREIQELERLKKEKAVEYFTKGSISREIYDGLLREYERKIAELEKKERMLKRKVGKKG